MHERHLVRITGCVVVVHLCPSKIKSDPKPDGGGGGGGVELCSYLLLMRFPCNFKNNYDPFQCWQKMRSKRRSTTTRSRTSQTHLQIPSMPAPQTNMKILL